MKRISDKNKPIQRADANISVWQQQNTYTVDDVVYDALHNHIVKRTSMNPAEATETTPPSESNRWTLVNSIPVWAANIRYPLNFILEQDGILYKCNNAHTSTTFVADSANWTAISAAGGIIPWELIEGVLPPTAVPGSLLEVVVGGVYNGSPYNVGDVVAVLSDGVNVVRLSNSIPSVPSLSSAAGVLTVDLSLSDYYTITLTENITSIVFTNALGGTKPSTKMFEITQGTTPYTVTWPVSFLWEGAAPVVSDTANAIDILAITSFNGGTTWHGTLSKGRA